MGKHVRLRKWYVKQNPQTGKTMVHLHGIERRLLGTNHYSENLTIPYIAGEKTKRSVRRAMSATETKWKVGLFSGL